MKDPLLLASGEMVVPLAHRGEGFYSAQVLWAPATSRYPAGGYDIVISPSDIYQARTLSISDEIAASLIAGSKPHPLDGQIVSGSRFNSEVTEAATGQTEPTVFTILTVRGSQIDVQQDGATEIVTMLFEEVQRCMLMDKFIGGFGRAQAAHE